MTPRTKLILLLAEVAAVATLHVVYRMHQDGLRLPRGGKVQFVNGRPVYRPSTGKQFVGPDRPREGIAGVYTPPPARGVDRRHEGG